MNKLFTCVPRNKIKSGSIIQSREHFFYPSSWAVPGNAVKHLNHLHELLITITASNSGEYSTISYVYIICTIKDFIIQANVFTIGIKQVMLLKLSGSMYMTNISHE